MKKILLFLAILFFCAWNFVSAQGIGAYMSHGTFNIPGQSPYVEVYLEIIGNTLVYKQLPSGKYQGSIQVTMIVTQDSAVKDFRKYELLSAELADTSGVGVNFIDQQRFTLPNGSYTLELSIGDKNVAKEPVKLQYPISVDFPNEKCTVSTIQFVNSYTRTNEPNVLSKSGYDLVPMVDNFFPSDKGKLIFYSEIYNPAVSQQPNDAYLVSYYIESFENRKILNEYARSKKETAKPAMVVMNEFDISKLPSGNYNLVVSVKDRSNNEVASNTAFFQRSNPSMDNAALDYASVDLSSSFSSKITNADTLKEFIKSLTPIATETEKIFINYQAPYAQMPVLQQFFQRFWEARDVFDPAKAWTVYNIQVQRVNEAYGTQVKKGYDTDMGYVFLRYGEPSTIQDIPFESSSIDGESSVPYQIWQYYSLFGGRERNKRFVFVNKELGAREYTLVHSDVKGEIQDYGWRAHTWRKKKFAVDRGRDELFNSDSRASTRYFNPY